LAKKLNMMKEVMAHEKHKHVTSIGDHPSRSRPKNKNKRKSWKAYRGQGK